MKSCNNQPRVWGMLSDMLTTTALAARLGVDRSTITRKCQTGELEYQDRMPGYNGDYLFTPAYADSLLTEDAA